MQQTTYLRPSGSQLEGRGGASIYDGGGTLERMGRGERNRCRGYEKAKETDESLRECVVTQRCLAPNPTCGGLFLEREGGGSEQRRGDSKEEGEELHRGGWSTASSPSLCTPLVL